LALDAPELRSLRQRLAFLAAARPDLGLPRFDSVLLDLLPAAAAGKRTYAELRSFPFYEAFLGALNRAARQALDRDAPERLEVPSGSRIAVDYSDPARPVLAARIQELFGLAETPRLAGGRAPVLLHLLAPNGRPQQVTHDLASFWKNTYPQVRKEFAGRYPKHSWPDDPASARPERRPARRRPG
jgi:ATP-dependent helicase HrpB